MRLKVALLTMTAALVMTMGMTGCMNRDNVTTKNARPNNMYRSTDGVRPLDGDYRFNANRYNTNFNGNGYRTNTLDNNYGGTFGTRGNNNDGMFGNNNGGMFGNNNGGMYGRNYDMNGGRYGMQSMNGKMEMSQKIANKVAAIKGVKSANVLLTNNNAYVAVQTDDTAGTRGLSGMNGNRSNARSFGTTTKRTNMGTYSNRTNTYNNGIGANDVDRDLKNKIANTVKKEAPNCNNVYVSANPDFVDRMNRYMNQAGNGQPLTGLANEIQEMIYRVFPTNAGANTTGPNRLNNMAPGR
ncbi:YhcN/YlaJ family sporulation lipoprotein [Paenibacillus apiarius]|uniref:YhcN/YlaJ family sporulation lipoprotein n=1 Tax=Paenibacillus apiarius TaxID=46240 RepID=A0ABT4E1S7_9BACL|nr:YhcN/YlaJ family sporulation lipoprotein [Paenibacillus apiarius]MCY9516477.1 YhcN/YlaJ family sporulation lipoprotein [Paenibacillus apiarius]MCY9522468.1 YhcN/YlaJ family sporulation lipoprotein [Paenibacillus apiarius]MCY9554608.1 YhcN/YlaJ family sporulation lipoprotein [Paenibacillus apiarius]MCY9556724.1 YhcN/YlaJ family sporulation lipoprotein [Paenibacillus apiarius]MCY9686595.1 YhcN/YlaJ family sporulation lipoprotein [Paenibacillus apiarius]